MKLSQWAKKSGLSYQTAFNLFKKGQLPGKVTQLASGTILIEDDPIVNRQDNLKTYIYCRVSSANKKEDLARQVDRCLQFCNANGWEVVKVYKEIASGMNDNRKQLNLLLDATPKRIVVEHKDRLTRFGFNYLSRLLNILNYQLVVINRDQEDEADLIKDLVAIITSFCCRLYGLRRGSKKVKAIKATLEENND
jgi:predicted site-specific integrase-resolvase